MTKVHTTKFFGVDVSDIKSEEDAFIAVEKFCCYAADSDIIAARKELKKLSTTNPMWYNIINDLLWNIELPLGSHAWCNRFKLLNAEFK